jgi:hypothetical protein
VAIQHLWIFELDSDVAEEFAMQPLGGNGGVTSAASLKAMSESCLGSRRAVCIVTFFGEVRASPEDMQPFKEKLASSRVIP